MTVDNQTNKTRQSGDGATVTFNFLFPIFNNTDIEVYKIDTSTTPETSTLQTITTDYTVTISKTTEGGSVTYTTAPTSDEDAFIKRVLPFTQTTNIEINSNFPEENVEDEFDKSRMIDIQVQEETDRTLKVNEFYDGSADFEIADPEASKVIGWDSTGLIMANYSGSDLDTILTTSYGQQLVQSANALGARNVLELGTTDDVEFAQITGSSYVGLPDATTSVKGVSELATNAETKTGTDTARPVVPSALLSLFNTSSIANPGYSRIPVNEGGAFTEKIEQWGNEVVEANTTDTVNLPITYPNAHLNAQGTYNDAVNSIDEAVSVQTFSTSQIKVTNGDLVSHQIFWYSIGN